MFTLKRITNHLNIKVKSLLTGLLLLLICFNTWGQSGPIKGTVKDESGKPLPGVNVIYKGTHKGTTTDLDGNFELPEQPEGVNIFVVSFVGYKTQEITIGDKRYFDIVMEKSVQQLEELVVVGYGTKKKADLTGSVSSVNMEDFGQLQVDRIDEGLQGMASGVRVSQATGHPGGEVDVRIRGIGSIHSDNEPLYVVDGIPTKNALSTLSPDDIKSISILKDASSTAIYGSRANNGVVLITTKEGNKGEAQIEFKLYNGLQMHGPLTDMTNKDQYIEVYNEAARNDNADVEMDLLKRNLISDELAQSLPDINHLDRIFRNALQQKYYLSVNGGDQKTQYVVAGNYFNQEGILLNSGYERFSGKLSVTSKPLSGLEIGTNINASAGTKNIQGASGDGFGGNGGSSVRYAFFRTPAIPVYDEEGNFVDLPEHPEFFGDGYNPVGLLENFSNIRHTNRLFGNVFTKLSFWENFTYTSRLGIDYSTSNRRRFNKTWGTNNRINNPNSLTAADEQFNSWTWNNVLNYSITIGDNHNITATVGSEAIKESWYNKSTTEHDFKDQDPDVVYLGNGQGSIGTSEDKFGSALLSFFARADYNYNGKYLFSATIREDGSSRLAESQRWGTFYSSSIGWRLDKENFLKDAEFISQLKIRGGIGFIGNQNIGYYAYSDQINPGFNYSFGGVSQNGYAMTVLGNDDVHWETSNQYDIGTDILLFDNRIDLTVNYYQKYTKDMLTRESIPTSAGYADPAWVNSGQVKNTGLELQAGYKNKIGNFFYRISGNFALLNNEVTKLKSPILSGRIDNGVYATKTEEGYPIGSFFLYEMIGIYQNESDIITHAYQGEDIKPGDVMYKDQNGDGVINADDRTHVGSGIPDYTAGLNLQAKYRNFDIQVFIQGAYGQEIYYQVATDIEGFYRPFNLTMRYYNNRWTGEGTSNTQPRASWDAKANNTRPSTRFLEDGSYTRLKSLQIGYSLSESLLKKLSMQKARIYLSGKNLFTITDYPGLDPEMTVSDNSEGEGDRAANIDWGTYPSAIGYNIGLQITF